MYKIGQKKNLNYSKQTRTIIYWQYIINWQTQTCVYNKMAKAQTSITFIKQARTRITIVAKKQKLAYNKLANTKLPHSKMTKAQTSITVNRLEQELALQQTSQCTTISIYQTGEHTDLHYSKQA